MPVQNMHVIFCALNKMHVQMKLSQLTFSFVKYSFFLIDRYAIKTVASGPKGV